MEQEEQEPMPSMSLRGSVGRWLRRCVKVSSVSGMSAKMTTKALEQRPLSHRTLAAPKRAAVVIITAVRLLPRT